MPSRAEILDPEREHPFTVTASSGDRRTSVSSSVIRCIYEGQRAVAVGDDANAKTQIAALLDLLHLHYDGADEATPSVTNRDEVTIILVDKNEAVDALCTLRDNVVGAPRVNIRVHEPAQSLSLVRRSALDLADQPNLYPGWSDLLKAVGQPPKLVETLAHHSTSQKYAPTRC